MTRDSENVTLRITVPREAYERMKVKAAGAPVAPFIAERALAWVNETSSTADVSDAEWKALGEWLRDNSGVLPAKPDTLTTKSALLAWCEEHGFPKRC